jgi:hypothetical protein
MMMMMRKRINKERRTKMTLQKDISKNSKTRLEALRKEFRRRSEERKKSGKSLKGIPSLTLRNQDGKGKVLRFSHQLKKSKDFPSMTLEEQRREGLSTEPTLVISIGKKRKR